MKRDTRRPPGRKPAGPVGDVKLGFSFFEKWVFRLKVRRISRRRRAPHGDGFEAVSPPASRSRRSATVRAAIRCGASKFELFSHPNGDAGGGSLRRSERVGEALRVPCSAPLNPVRAAGTLGGRVRRVLRGSVQPPSSSGATPGGARLADRKRQRSETPGGLSQPTAQRVPHARGACRHVRALTGKT
jgi:hypothetical protein